MKNVGLYGVLIQNSIQKTSWKQFGFLKFDEQMNLIFAVMLYIMEQSLREENCTMDDIGAYIDTINTRYLGKEISYDDCRKLGDFVVNVILSNEGRAMYFDGYDFEENDYHVMHISYVANRIVYLDQEVRRTSYYLTDDGYNLILSTLEIENNMKLTIHEMIFQMHLEKQSYDKAVDEITLDGMVSDALSKMTLKEKIGQLFVVCTDSLDFNAETEVTEKMGKNLEEYKPGGVIFFFL